MAILVGIDEAGYGPILGPLVVSAAVFEVPQEQLTTPLWDILRTSVCKTRQAGRGRVVINDSKKLHQGKGKYTALQRSVMSCLTTITPENQLPTTIGQLLANLDADCHDQLTQYPWYGLALNDHKLDLNPDDISLAAAALNTEMAQTAVTLKHLWSCPLPAGHFNQLVQSSNNKATVLFSLASRFIDRAWRQYQGQNLQIVVDKQGGRSHYRANLQRLFPELTMKILKEQDSISSYEMRDGQAAMKIHFIAKGDGKQLPIALASMISKYVRELFMEVLNAYFIHHDPELKPTAGYYQDGTRFLKDLKAKLPATLIPEDLLVRQR